MKLIIPGELPDLNTIIDAAKRGKGRWQPYNELKRESTEAVAWPAKRLPKASRVYLVITWYCKDKRKDPDNIAAAVKFIWDGLVAAGVIPNDGWKENAGWENHFEVDKQNPRVEIDLMYLGGDSHGKATPMKVEPLYRQCPGEGGKNMKLKRATYRHVEAEIYDYYKTLQAMDEFREDIILANGRQEAYGTVVGGRYAGTSIVERRATELADSDLLKGMERITKAIEDTYSRLKEIGRQVVWVKYGLALEGWEPPAELAARMEGRNRFDMSPDDMAEVLNVDRATFHRYRSGFVYGVAERLGWY